MATYAVVVYSESAARTTLAQWDSTRDSVRFSNAPGLGTMDMLFWPPAMNLGLGNSYALRPR